MRLLYLLILLVFDLYGLFTLYFLRSWLLADVRLLLLYFIILILYVLFRCFHGSAKILSLYLCDLGYIFLWWFCWDVFNIWLVLFLDLLLGCHFFVLILLLVLLVFLKGVLILVLDLIELFLLLFIDLISSILLFTVWRLYQKFGIQKYHSFIHYFEVCSHLWKVIAKLVHEVFYLSCFYFDDERVWKFQMLRRNNKIISLWDQHFYWIIAIS